MTTKMVRADALTLQEIRQNGLEALARELGIIGMVRFLQQFETGHGDYTAERDQWLDQNKIKARVKEVACRHEQVEEKVA